MSTLPNIEQLRKLSAEATPGPWEYHAGFPPWIERGGVTGSIYAKNGEYPVVAKPHFVDAVLIAEMRNALDALLDVVEAAQDVAKTFEVRHIVTPTRTRLEAALARFTREESQVASSATTGEEVAAKE